MERPSIENLEIIMQLEAHGLDYEYANGIVYADDETWNKYNDQIMITSVPIADLNHCMEFLGY